MSIRRVGVLLGKEFSQGWRNVVFIWAIVIPVAITIVVSLLFGSVFSGKARLGLTDGGSSQIAARAAGLTSLQVKTYPSAEALRAAVAEGMADVGIVLPAGFDEQIKRGEKAAITAYIWGESTLKNRTVAGAAFVMLARELTGQEAPVALVTSIVGQGTAIPWEARLLPLIVLMAVIVGGAMVPAALLVEEKQKRTLRALTTSAASLGEVFAAKGLLGGIISFVMAVITLVLNRAWGPEPGLLLLTLALGAVMAASIGVLVGGFLKDMNMLMTAAKGSGILLYGPAIIYMFPEIPQWIGRFFPTYYLIQPVVEITQQGGAWATVAPELAVLAVLDVILLAVIAVVVHKAPETEGALNPA